MLASAHGMPPAALSGSLTAIPFSRLDTRSRSPNTVRLVLPLTNIGAWPDPVDEDAVGEFIAAVCPDAVLALIAKVRELEQDAARLDWLDQAAHCADWVEGEPVKRVIRADDGEIIQGDTWRAAIDAARGGKEHG
ncbi:hypothetical protein [Cupriavidus gilardii]|uniref:hypothetical protein n=1 Tax=Cupriavidus gilardii TaxID=82541 RepID=UPI0015730D3A|nr:hypothetical protein [Cupriavidus gilardii]NSX05071.1 hypothetical protein [Cupriavidus gilardii]